MGGAQERDRRRTRVSDKEKQRVHLKDIEASHTRASDVIDDSQREIERSRQLIKDADVLRKDLSAITGKRG
jgi:hypothetical protein